MPPKQRQAPPRYNPISNQDGLTAPGCSDLEASINILASSVNYWAQQINQLQTELAKAYLDCDAERSKGWVGYFWPACARLEELKANHARVLETYNKLNARWNQAIIATNDLRCNINACTNTNNSLANPILGGNFTPTNIDDLLNPIKAFKANQEQKTEKIQKAFNFLKDLFTQFNQATVRKVFRIEFNDGQYQFEEVEGTNIIQKLFDPQNGAFGPDWEQRFATNIPGLCDDPNDPKPDQILPELKNFVEALRGISRRDSSTNLKKLKEVLKPHTRSVANAIKSRRDQAKQCVSNFDKLIAQMETAKQDIQNTSNKIDMLKRQITKAFYDTIEFTATGSIQYSPANIAVAPGAGPDLQLNLTPSQAAQLVTKGRTREDKVFFAINIEAVRRLLTEKFGESEDCPQSGPPPVDPPPEDDRGVWWKYPIKATIIVTPKFKQDPLAPNNAFIMALRDMSVGPDYKLEWKDSANTTLACDNIPAFKTNKTYAGQISIFGQANRSIESNVTYNLDPVTIEQCEGVILP